MDKITVESALLGEKVKNAVQRQVSLPINLVFMTIFFQKDVLMTPGEISSKNSLNIKVEIENDQLGLNENTAEKYNIFVEIVDDNTTAAR